MKALKEANKWCSLYIRLRDAIEYNRQFREDITGVDPINLVAACVTCGQIKQWILMEAGHYIGRSSKGQSGVYFDERNIHIQCEQCNKGLDVKNEYENYMLGRYGQKVIDELHEKDKEIRKRGRDELMAFALHYQELYHQLLKNL